MAAHGIINNFVGVMCVPVNSAISATPPIIGRYCGMGDKESAMKKAKQLIILVAIIQAAVSLVAIVFVNPLSRMMSDVSEVQALVKQILIVTGLAMPLGYTLSFIMPAAMRSSGDAKYVLYVNVIIMFTVRLGVAYLLTNVIRTGIVGIWIGQYSDWAARIIFFMPRFLKGKWLEFSLLDRKSGRKAVEIAK